MISRPERLVRSFGLALSLAMLVTTAKAEAYALLPASAVSRLAAARATPEAGKMVRDARQDLSLTPHPMARIHVEGTLDHQGIRDQSQQAMKDLTIAETCAFAYRIDGDKKFLDQAAKFEDAWFTVYQVSGNPIDETSFDRLFLAFDLTREDLPAAVKHDGVEFFRGMSRRYLDWLDANYAKDPYNWSSHRVKLAVLGAYSSGDVGLIERATHAFTRQVKQNLRPDGSVNDFYKRDALHYVVYDLEPLTTAALAAKAHGLDWFHTAKTGSPSVEMGVDWLVPYATGAKTHEEFVHSTVAFDAARDKAGEKGYSGPWEPVTSVGLFSLANWMDPKYGPVAYKLYFNGAKIPFWITLVANASKYPSN